MIINRLILGAALLASMTTLSCKKQGCTDVDATNYDLKAKKDDGTCSFQGENVIWYGQSTADSLVNDGAVTLTYYVDGNVVGSSAANVYWTGAPDCGQNGSITITKDLGSVKTQSFTYRVVDQTGFEYWSGILNFKANTCTSLELTW